MKNFSNKQHDAFANGVIKDFHQKNQQRIAFEYNKHISSKKYTTLEDGAIYEIINNI